MKINTFFHIILRQDIIRHRHTISTFKFMFFCALIACFLGDLAWSFWAMNLHYAISGHPNSLITAPQ